MIDRSSSTRGVADGIHAGLRGGRRRQRRPHPSRFTTFSESLAHDVRTPLTVIQEYAALMSEGLVGDLTDEQRRILDVIADRASDLNRAIDNAVDASKLGTKNHRVWGRRCRLADILTQIRPQLLRKAAVRNVDLHLDPQADLPPNHCDPDVHCDIHIHCDAESVARAIANIVSGVLNLSAESGRITISQDVDWELKEAGIRLCVDGPSFAATLEAFRELAGYAVARNDSDEMIRSRELDLAAQLIACNLGRIAAEAANATGATLWIGFPLADSVEVLRRHLVRAMRHHPDARRVSLFRAAIRESHDEDISRDVGNILNSIIGRRDLAVELDGTRWLLSIVQRPVGRENLCRRIERRRQRINRRRLGRPLPEISLQSYGLWRLPEDHTRLLSTIGRWIEKGTPVESGAT
jgi:His Kinase A (phospho-acceptor) domain